MNPTHRNVLSSGDIVLVPHAPFSSQVGTKARPVLVLSTRQFNSTQADVVCIAISSKLRVNDPYRVELHSGSKGFSATGLKQSSCVKCNAIFAYEASKITRRLGHLPDSCLESVRGIVRVILGL